MAPLVERHIEGSYLLKLCAFKDPEGHCLDRGEKSREGDRLDVAMLAVWRGGIR